MALNNSKTVLNIRKLIMSQVFLLDMLSFEVKLILRVSSPLNINEISIFKLRIFSVVNANNLPGEICYKTSYKLEA